MATAEVFGQCVLFAPTIEDKIRITRYQHEELKHFQLLARIMSELGVDMDAYIQDRQRAGSRFTGDEADMQIQDWMDATLFNFMIDRAATFQLTEYIRGSYVPLAKAKSHRQGGGGAQDFGEECWSRCARTRPRAPRSSAASRSGSWRPRIFGRAGTEQPYCRRWG